ncbi:hypothetical protein [Glaciibacter superstes]|uniref:hypothetical protein n=1 Tax=Glaciibacter superstes TaxID=501023 RepID=UPI0003B791EB|nr:hypothetical protein [Glaciibacter superstes]
MGFVNAVLGRDRRRRTRDQRAVERYEYLVGLADTAETQRIHDDNFARLTEAQRDLMFDQFLMGLTYRKQRRDPRSGPPSDRFLSYFASSAATTGLAGPFLWTGFIDPGPPRNGYGAK